MTSNIGSHLISEKIEETGGDFSSEVYSKLQDELMDQLKQTIRPEFLNRVDDIIIFHPLAKEHIRAIVDIQLKRVHRMLAQREVQLTVTEPVKNWLAERGYDPVYGARPLKRLIQKEIVNKIATELIKQDEEGPVEFEAALSKDGGHIEFAEVFEDADAWAD